jgi:methyl-accepting chemotaxis protein
MKRFFSSIRGKLMLITGAGTLMLLASALYGFWGADQNQQKYQALLAGEVDTERSLLTLNSEFSRLVLSWNKVLSGQGNPAQRQAQKTRYEHISSTIQKQLASLQQQHGGDDIGKTVRRLRMLQEQLHNAYRKGKINDDELIKLERDIISPAYDLLEKATTQISTQRTQLEEHAGSHAHDTIQTGLIAMALAIIFAFLQFNFSLQKFILKPSHELSEKLKRMAAHDFSIPIVRHSNDELGDIAESACTIREAMLEMVRELHTASTQLDTSVSQLTEVIEITRNGVEQQLRQTEQVAAAINEMTSSMQEVAEHAGIAADSANSADGAAQDGRRIVTDTIENIESMAQEMQSATGTISGLEQESEKIGGVLDVIKDISEQTNLLALNAAIEAARAGEQGRGFAVVADEVRALATRTQKSTEEIEEMIERLQTGAAQAVAVMEKSRLHTQSSTEQSASAGTSLENITSSVTQITRMNAQIAEAATQQMHVVEEINRNIMSISEITELSSEGGKRIYEANTNLNGISERLRQLVTTFKID